MGNIIKHIKNHFSLVIALVCLSLFSFNFWLFYPGYISIDWGYIMRTPKFNLSDWHPVIYPFSLKHISTIFGRHIYYSLLFNLIPFYLGIYTLILGFWKKFQSQYCWLGLLPIFIGNIYFNNIIMHSSFTSPMLIFLLWTIVLYQILVGITQKNIIALSITFILALISRHNAIIQVYPIFFIYSYFIVQKLKPSHKFIKYIALCTLFAGLSIIISLCIPNILKQSPSSPSTHIFLHQIAGVCIPNQDEKCFKKEWYDEGRTFADVTEKYLSNPTLADKMTWDTEPNHPFKKGKLRKLPNKWLKSIIKYPYNYIKYINRFREIMWHQNALEEEISLTESLRCIRASHCEELKGLYSTDELFYKPSSIKVKIYNFIKKYLIQIPTIIFISINFILLIISGILFIKKRNILLLYTLSSSIAGITASIIFCAFSPTVFTRYIYPVITSSLIATIGITLYFCIKEPILNIKIISITSKKEIKKYIIIFSIISLLFGTYLYLNRPLTARVDIYTKYTETPSFIAQIQNTTDPVVETRWMPKFNNRGVTIQQHGQKTAFRITALQNNSITIALRGPDERDANGKRYEKWVKYTDFRINGKKILSKPVEVWHDKPYKYTLPAQKAHVYKIKLKWTRK